MEIEINLSDINDIPEKYEERYSVEERSSILEKHKQLEEKLKNGIDFTIEDQKDYVLYFRVFREEKFLLGGTEKEVTKKIKKLSRAKTLELINKRDSNVEIEIEEHRCIELFVNSYKGKKITKRDFHVLCLKKQYAKLNEIEEIDYEFNLI